VVNAGNAGAFSGKPQGCGEYPSRGYLVPETQEQFSVSHRDVVNAENAGAVFSKPQGCGEYPSRGYLVPETHADRAVSFPEALLHSRHIWQSDVGTRAPKVGALKRRRSSCRGAVLGSSEGGSGAAHNFGFVGFLEWELPPLI